MPDPSPSSEAVRCPLCGRPTGAGDRFCEFDGTPLEEDSALQVLAAAHDLAAASKRGPAHLVDQDAYALGRREREGRVLHLLVVCDGVSSSSHGEQASARAAEAALAELLAAADSSSPLDPAAALRGAVAAAHRAACAPDVEAVADKEPSGTTLVAAVAHGGGVDVAWVGDSRAYLVRPAAPGERPAAVLLTHDHSWLNEVVESGEQTRAEAARSPRAHALTHCLGPLEDPDPERPPEPSLAQVPSAAGGRLVLCSDGLWNATAGPWEVAELASLVPATADARALAVHLVRRGLAAGGPDDVTAAVALLPGE